MAGVKITDLGTLTTAVAADLLYIVDVSDTSQSPQGTSKQIEVGNLFESGTWTPTFSAFTNAITAATLNEATYMRVGNIVTCAIFLSIDVDFSTYDNGALTFTFPIAPTTVNGGGSCSSSNTANQFNGVVRDEQIILQSLDTSLIKTGSFHALFQYEIN